MQLYFIYIMILPFLILDSISIKSKLKNFLSYFPLGLMTLLVGFQGTGRDYNQYKYYYKLFPDIKELLGNLNILNDYRFEKGYILFCSLIKLFFKDFNVFLFIFSIISLFFIHIFIKKYTKYYFTALLVYYSNFFMYKELTQIRLSIAMGIFLFAIENLKKRKMLNYIILILIATLFHKSLFITLPLYFIYPLFENKSFKFYILILIISIILLYCKIDFTSLFYGKSELANIYLRKGSAPFRLIFFKRIILYSIIIFFFNKYKIKDKDLELKIFFYFFSIFFYCLFSFNVEMAERFSNIFAVFEVVLIPNVIYYFKKGQNKIFTLIISIFILLIILNRTIAETLPKVQGYKTIFQTK